MGINETFGFEKYLGYSSYANYSAYLRENSFNYLRLASYNRNFLYSAKAYVGALNSLNMYTGGEYARITVFPGGKTYYNVMDASSYSANAYGGATSNADFDAQLNAIASGASVKVYANNIAAKLHLVKSLAALQDDEYLSEESKAEIKAYVNDAKARLAKLDKYLQNEAGYSADQLNAILSAELKEIEAIVEETNEKVKGWQDERTDAEQAALDEALDDSDVERQPSGVKRGSGAASGPAVGSKVDSLSEDEELDDAKSKTRYGMSNEASIPAAGDVSSFVTSATADDFTTKEKFIDLFGKEKDINEKNIIEVLDAMTDKAAFVDKLAALKDGDKDYSEKALKEIAKLLKARVKVLDKAGHIEATDKNIVNAHINNLISYASNVTANKTTIVSTLDTIVTTLKDKGTETVVTAAIEAKQNEAKEKAPKEFREDYAKAENKTYDATKTYVDFPEEITYLPNKRLFQVTIKVGEVTHYFEAGNFKSLDDVIVKKNPGSNGEILAEWKAIKDKLLEEPGATPEV